VDLVNNNLVIVGGLVGFLVLIIAVCLCLPSHRDVPAVPKPAVNKDKKDKPASGKEKDKNEKVKED